MTPPGADAPVVPLSLDATARLLGGYAWFDGRLFEVTGRWVPSEGDPATKAHLAALSRRLGEHAQVVTERIPVTADHDPVALTAPPDDRGPALVAALEHPATAPRLAGLHEVLLPRLRATFDAHRSRTTPATDGPTRRALDLALTDLDALQGDGVALLGRLEPDREVTDHVARLRAVAGDGPLLPGFAALLA